MQRTDLFIWGIFLGLLFAYIISRKYKRYKTKKILKKAKSAERKAVVLLKKWGYHVLDVQLKETVTIYIDNKPHDCLVRADLLVRRGWKKYIVEVKTGAQTQATLPNVRRQLLEYYLVYKPDGILLLDMEKEQLKKVNFTCTGTAHSSIKPLILAIMIGICLGYGLLKILGGR